MRRAAAGSAASVWCRRAAGATPAPVLTDPGEIRRRVEAARPLAGGRIPADIAGRLGATHYDGRYHLTDKPFLVEGAEALHRLGFGVAKFWLNDGRLPGYGYHSDWRLPERPRLVELIRHPYFRAALELPFRTVALVVSPVAGSAQFLDPEHDFAEDEAQVRELAADLLERHRARDITIIVQHWEGDWMLRSRVGDGWPGPPERLERCCDGFVRWLGARQRGVERARREAGATRCRVLHAAEVNRVMDGMRGIPDVTTRVLPRVGLDLVSWSCYDGLADPVKLWQGIEWIRGHLRPAAGCVRGGVYLGEIGMPERERGEAEIVETWDRALGVCLALEVPWIIHWELYCNEPQDGTKDDRRVRKAEELRGFWLVRPDGSLSRSGRYLTDLLAHAGGWLPGSGRGG